MSLQLEGYSADFDDYIKKSDHHTFLHTFKLKHALDQYNLFVVAISRCECEGMQL